MPAHNNLAYVDEDAYIRTGYARPEDCDVLQRRGHKITVLRQVQEETSVTSRSRKACVSVGILCFINLINYMDRFTIAGVLNDVKTYYNLGNTVTGLLQTSFIVSYMIMAPLFGYLGDRYSRKTIIACGVAFWSITTLVGSFVPDNLFGIFIFLRALVGTGEASYSTIAPTIIADLYSKDHRSKMLAFFYFAIPVGSGLGYIVGSQVASYFGSWQWALRVTPVLGILSVILTLALLREPPRGEAEGGSHLMHTGLIQDLKDLRKNYSFVLSTLGFTCVTFATGALAWWAPMYMQNALRVQSEDISTNQVSMIFGIITCIAGIVGVISGSFASQYFRRSNSRADPLICAFGILSSVPLLFAGCVIADRHSTLAWILIFFGEVFLSLNWTIVADMLLYVVIPTRRSIAEAVQILTSHALGDASSPYIVGAVSDAISSGDTTVASNYISLQYALYIPAFTLVLGGFFFFLTAAHIEKDRMKCTLITHGNLPSLHCFPNEQKLPQPVQAVTEDHLWPTDTEYLV